MGGSANSGATGTARRFEWIVAAGALFLLANALDRGLHSWSWALPLPPARAVLLPFFAVAVALLVRSARASRAAVAAAWPALVPVGLAAASAWWSTDPAVTASWTAALVGTTAVGLLLAARFSVDEQVELVCVVLAVATLASIAVCIGWPAVGVRGRTWAGIFEDNNLLGRAMSLSVVACAVAAVEQRHRRVLAGAGAAASMVVLLASRSVAPRVVTAMCLAALAAAVAVRGGRGSPRTARMLLIGVLAAAAVGAAVVAAGGGDRLLGMLGRDATLSGRTRLWSAAVRIGRERVWAGHGYATFWPRAHAAGGALADRIAGLPVRHPHNGFIEIFFELGLLGVLSVVIPLLALLWRAWSSALARPETSLWPAAALLFLLLSNLAESDLLRHKVFWALYVAAAAAVWGGARRGAAAGEAAPHAWTSTRRASLA